MAGGVKCFVGGMCPVKISKSGAKVPRNPMKEVRKHIAFFMDLEKRNKQRVLIVKGSNDLTVTKRIKAILGIEGCYFVNNQNDLKLLGYVKSQGVNIICPVWNINNALAHSCNDKTKDTGLTTLGREFIMECNRLNIILDGAHASPKTLEGMLETSSKPIIVSHTACRAIFKHSRNISDKLIKAVADKGGIIGVTFVGEFIGGINLDDLIKHIRHLLHVACDTNICLGSDFDGMEMSDVIKELEDVRKYDNLYMKLCKEGLSIDTINKISWNNAYNFFIENLEKITKEDRIISDV